MKKRMYLYLALAFTVMLQAISVAVPPSNTAQAFGATDFLKTDGKFIKNNSGTGQIVNLRGTNLGGWLTQEDWMSPLGEFAADRTGWSVTASVNGAAAGNALDGSGSTFWDTGTNQSNGQWFQVNMGTPTLFNRIYLDAASRTGDYPNGYQILVSNDAVNWKDAASGSGSAANTIVRFTPQVAQYIRVVQTGSAAGWWSISEFNVFSESVINSTGMSASASSTASGYTPASGLDGDVNTRWTSGAAQASGQSYTINLGKNTPVGRFLMDAGPGSAGDYPRSYEVYGSTDGTNWTKYASGFGSSRITYVEFWWSDWMQYIKVVQTGSSSNWWSIADVAVYTGGEFDRYGWNITASATASGTSAANVKDANGSTRWSTGAAQAGGQWLQADMGAAVTFNQIQLDSGESYPNDYPRGYTVQVSKDGTNWTQVATGQGFHRQVPINFPAVSARYIKINQTGTSSSWWSVSEMNVYLNNDDYDLNISLKNRFGQTTAESIIGTHQNTWITSSDLDNVANIGMNVIRLPISWLNIVNEDGTFKTNAWTKIDWLVNQAAARNLYVLLDLHTLPGGDCPWGSCGRVGPNPNGFWTNTAYQDMVVEIWKAMADRYKGNPAVAGYDLMNEPLLDWNETSTILTQKFNYYDRLYDAVRAIDPDHMIFIEAFFNWNNSITPSTYGWTNVVYELHPYDMGNAKDWTAQNNLVTDNLAQLAAKQSDPNYNIPVLFGEYSLYYYDDVWSKWMGGLNAVHANWTNWTYKVRGAHNEGVGGYWGFYNTNLNPIPIINSDNSATMISKLEKFGTSNFQPNNSFIRTVSKFARGDDWMATVPLDQTGWTASASSTEAGSSAAYALDWNTGTRWSSGASQTGGQWFQVDMGSKKVIDQITFETKTTDKWDYPRAYQVQVSNDGSNWTTVASDKGFGWRTVVTFDPQFAQYIRINQTGAASEWWSIAEFHAYSEPALSRAGWTASASVTEPGGAAANAIDGNAGTRWSTGAAQANGQWYQVDMGRNQTFNRVLIDAGASANDYPRGYQVQVSTNGTSWTTVASGSTSMASAVVEFRPQVARYLKVVQTGTATSWWTIQELNVFGELEKSRNGWTAFASSTESGGSAGNAIDGSDTTRWSTGVAQASGQSFTVDLGSTQWFNHIVMDSGSNTNDYARKYLVQVSYDNANWTTVARGEGTGPVVTANFPIAEARYVKVTLEGSSSSWWSITDFRAYE